MLKDASLHGRALGYVAHSQIAFSPHGKAPV
jgi:hypothetical protein